MLGIIGSIISGGATGLLGSVVSRYFDYKNKKLDRVHEKDMLLAESKIMAQEWAAKSAIAKIEGEAAIEVEDSIAFKASLKNEPKKYYTGNEHSFGWLFMVLDFIRGCIRPALTIYLCVLTTLIYIHVKNLLGTAIDPAQLSEILNYLINTVLYLTTTVVLWWFGTRQKSPPPTK